MLLFILCGVYIWKWVERAREIRVETRRGFRRFVKWKDGRTRCSRIVPTLLEFLFLSFFVVVAMLFSLSRCIFLWFPYLLLSFWTEISFSVCVHCLFFLLLEYLARCRRVTFASISLNHIFTAETSPTCSCIVSLSLKSILFVYVFPRCIFATGVRRFESCIPPLLHPRVWKTFQSFNFIMLEYRTKVLLKEKSLRDWWIIFHTALNWTLSMQVVGIGTGQGWFQRKCSYISDHVTIDRSQGKR